MWRTRISHDVEGGFAPTFKEAVGRWRRRHRHPPPSEQWFAVHYRVGWLVERLTTLESIHLLRQGLDVRALAAERPKRRRDGQEAGDEDVAEDLVAVDAVEADPDLETGDPVDAAAEPPQPDQPAAGTPPSDGA